MRNIRRAYTWLFVAGAPDALWPRWLFLRALGFVYSSAFFALLFQINGLIGPDGILPAGLYLARVHRALPGVERLWLAPTLLWFGSGPHVLLALCWLGLLASVLLLFNLWPRASLLVCFLCFLSFVSTAQDFSSYQSDGMLLEAGFLALFFAPAGLRPGLGAPSPPSRASLWLLRWEWFRIYFESGLGKLLSGDVAWHTLSAMDSYYQNGPLPTWVGWNAAQLPHRFHVFTAGATLVLELVLVFLLFLPRQFRVACFLLVTPWEIAVIVTANYAFLNYLVLFLGLLLLDDRSLGRLRSFAAPAPPELAKSWSPRVLLRRLVPAAALTWVAYVTSAGLLLMLRPTLPLPMAPMTAVEPFRIANQYGLFATMTRGRYEIEFQGSDDGQHWQPYGFRYKPQALNERPRLYAPYQPRFDWNLWFASLGNWEQNAIVPLTEERLLDGSTAVLGLFRTHPFSPHPPRYVRAVLWQYWFTSPAEKGLTGNWWKRALLGLYAPVLTRNAAGKYDVVEWPQPLPAHR